MHFAFLNNHYPMLKRFKNGVVLFGLLSLSACVSVSDMADGLGQAMLSQDDPQTVRDGAPAFLLLLDGLVQSDPEDAATLMAGAKLYAAYAAVFVDDEARLKRMINRARDYSRRALCEELPTLCAVADSPFEVFNATLRHIDDDDIAVLHTYAVIWVAWIKANRTDWNAIADLAKVKAVMQRVIALDEGYDRGSAHLYLGLLNTLLPKNLGGNPDLARQHFERAVELSKGRDLMVKVHYAERYARLVFDKKLHDHLLHEVLQAEASEPGLTLLNTLAKEKAQQLLASGKEYF